jgi:hypothetical protein
LVDVREQEVVLHAVFVQGLVINAHADHVGVFFFGTSIGLLSRWIA